MARTTAWRTSSCCAATATRRHRITAGGLRASRLGTLGRSMWRRRPYVALAGGVLAAAILATGCGGSETAPVVPVEGASGASGAQGVALSKDQFIQQADAICGEANAALAGLNSATVGNGAETQAAQELQIVRSELTSMQALTPPSEDRSTLDAFLSALKDEVSALDAKKAALEQGGDTSTADSELASAKSSGQSAAHDYGFKACGKGAEAPSATPSQTTTTLAVPPATTPAPAPAAPAAPAPPATGGAPTGGATGGGTGGGATGGGSSGGGGT